MALVTLEFINTFDLCILKVNSNAEHGEYFQLHFQAVKRGAMIPSATE